MKDPLRHDPLDALGEAYEKMFERAVENFHKAEEKSGTLFHKLIDEAKEKPSSSKKYRGKMQKNCRLTSNAT